MSQMPGRISLLGSGESSLEKEEYNRACVWMENHCLFGQSEFYEHCYDCGWSGVDFVTSLEYMCFEKQSMMLKEMGLIHMYRPSLKGILCEQVRPIVTKLIHMNCWRVSKNTSTK